MSTYDRSDWLWGWHLFTERSVGKQAANFAGHWGIGIGSGLLWSAAVYYVPSAAPAWTILIPGPLVMVIREVLHWIDRGKPHLLDRVRDILESVVGALCAYGLAHFYI